MESNKHGLRAKAAALLCLCCCAYVASAQVLNAPPPPDVGIDQKLDSQVPLDLTFNDETGKPVKLGDLIKDKPTVLALVYLKCPMLCGEVMLGMSNVFNEMNLAIGKDYQVVTVSFNPKETYELAVQKKKVLLEQSKDPSGGAAGWHFLTGDQANIFPLARAVGFRYQYLPSTGDFAHGSGIMVLTPAGKVSHYFYGTKYSAPDLRLALIEASKGQIGSLADEIKLLCYMYDPRAGSYAFSVMRAMRICAALTLVVMVGLIGSLIWQERRKNRRAALDSSANARPVLTS